MDEVCFCSFEEIVSCLAEKTKISLPVLITACALGYIWVTRKKIKDVKKQCCVLEDDMRHIKRENFQLGEEIKQLKCAVSDTELLSSALNKCCALDKYSSKPRRVSPERTYDFSCLDSNRCISQKMKKRKSRKHSPACESNTLQLISYSTPEVYIDSTCKKSSPKCNNIEISRFEWYPRTESTKIGKGNKFDCNDCDFQSFIKPEKVSFCDSPCFEPKTKKCDFGSHNYRDRSATNKCKRSKSPEPIIQSFDCYRYVERKKPKSPERKLQMCKSDLTASCKSNSRERKTCKRPSTRRNPCQISENFDRPSRSGNRCKSPKRDDNECSPKNTCKSLKLKEKIENYKSEIKRDLNHLEINSDCTLCQKEKLSEKESFDLTKTDGNSCEYKHYSLKKWGSSRKR